MELEPPQAQLFNSPFQLPEGDSAFPRVHGYETDEPLRPAADDAGHPVVAGRPLPRNRLVVDGEDNPEQVESLVEGDHLLDGGRRRRPEVAAHLLGKPALGHPRLLGDVDVHVDGKDHGRRPPVLTCRPAGANGPLQRPEPVTLPDPE